MCKCMFRITIGDIESIQLDCPAFTVSQANTSGFIEYMVNTYKQRVKVIVVMTVVAEFEGDLWHLIGLLNRQAIGTDGARTARGYLKFLLRLGSVFYPYLGPVRR